MCSNHWAMLVDKSKWPSCYGCHLSFKIRNVYAR